MDEDVLTVDDLREMAQTEHGRKILGMMEKAADHRKRVAELESGGNVEIS
jgi:hypothetical protein